jgi:REP element-mobilizing transposase RayT
MPLFHSRGSEKGESAMERPVAYFITFTTYGTWLHGDGRGSVDKGHNRVGTEFIPPNTSLIRRRHSSLKDEPFEMNTKECSIVLKAILEVCKSRGWLGYAVHVRRNHVHAVIGAKAEPGRMMRDLKSYSTRAIKKHFDQYAETKRFWTRHGSTKYIWTQGMLASVMNYVKYEQGQTMAFGSTEL